MVQKATRLGGRSRTGRPLGHTTRGTTNPNRMRRVNRWMTGPQAWRLRPGVTGAPPIAVDLGYGASPGTAVEFFDSVRSVAPLAQVFGIEIEPERVARGMALHLQGLDFRLGGFEIPIEPRASVIRAFNVLRQYDEADVPGIWKTMAARLADDGVLIEGTCDEIGRRSSWVAITGDGPQSLSISLRFGAFDRPSDVAERLPKALIHRNVAGERIHGFLAAADAAWLLTAPLASFGNKQRFVAMCLALRASGWPICDTASRWRLGEMTVKWHAVAPRTGALALAEMN